jgi:hypothetical protein
MASAYTPTSFRARWDRWLSKTEAGIALCMRWRIWIARQVAHYQWEIDATSVNGPMIHGLRGKGVRVRWSDGFEVNQIANEVGMSRQTVECDMCCKDQIGIAAAESCSQCGARPVSVAGLYHP